MMKTMRPWLGPLAGTVLVLALSACNPGPATPATLQDARLDWVSVTPKGIEFGYVHGPFDCLTFPDLQATLDGQSLPRLSAGERVPTPEDVRAPAVNKALDAPYPYDCVNPVFSGIGAPDAGLHTLRVFDATASRELTFRVGSLSSVRVSDPSDGVLRQGELVTVEYTPAELDVALEGFDLDVGGGVMLDTEYARQAPQPRVPGLRRARVGAAFDGDDYRVGSFTGSVALWVTAGVVGCTFVECRISGPGTHAALQATFEGHARDAGP